MGMKCRRVQTCLAGISGKGLPEGYSKPPNASEPERKPRIPLQLIEIPSIAEIHQETLCVQMHRKTIASEPRQNANSSTQPTHIKRIARFSAAIPEVQMLNGKEMGRKGRQV